MKPINKSASKIAFISITATVCIAFLFCVITGKVVLETKDFLPLVAMAFTYYFTRNAYESKTAESTDTKKQIVFSDQKGE